MLLVKVGEGDLWSDHRISEGGMFGLVSLTRGAAVSISSNIAEGAAQEDDKEYSRFLSITQGSVRELDTHVQIAVMLGYITEDHPLHGLIDRV